MKENRIKIITCTLLVLIALYASYSYKTLVLDNKTNDSIPPYAKDRRVVSVWIKENYYTSQLRELVNNYNIKNQDELYIDLNIEGRDYYNLVRLSLQTSEKPDIFQFGFSDLLKDDKLTSLEDAGIDIKGIPQNNLYYYKGKPMGVKISGNNVKVAWNKEIFKGAGLDPNKPPKTWNEVVEYSRKIKKAYPNIVPFEFPASSYHELRFSIGENSVNKGSVYTSFWNYKTGEYDFQYSKDILGVYKTMYKEGLIPENFNTKNVKSVREDFAGKSTAMILSTYEDKTYFLSSIPIHFELGISDLPKINTWDKEKYYFGEDTTVLAINKNNQNLEDIRKVFKFIVDKTVNQNEVGINKFKSQSFEAYSEYDSVKKFSFEEKDPTGVISFPHVQANQLFYDAIKGSEEIDDVISKLNSFLNGFRDRELKNDKAFFENYVNKE